MRNLKLLLKAGRGEQTFAHGHRAPIKAAAQVKPPRRPKTGITSR